MLIEELYWFGEGKLLSYTKAGADAGAPDLVGLDFNLWRGHSTVVSAVSVWGKARGHGHGSKAAGVDREAGANYPLP